jgi:hypothetical protein
MDVTDLFVALTISNQPMFSCWVYHCECKQACDLAGVLILNGVVPPDPHKPWPRDTLSDSAILGGSIPYFLRVCSFFVI